MATIPTFNTPPAPDIRQQRPEYFYGGATQMPPMPQAAYPQGFQPYDPNADQWQNEVPNLWPELEQQLRNIIERGPGTYYEGTPERPLTEQEREHNKMLMAWKSPSGLSAIETGKYREAAEREKNIDRAHSRIQKLEATLVKLGTSKTPPPPAMVKAFERRYNKAVEEYESMTKGDSGYPRYTGEGKFKLEGEQEKKGITSRIIGGLLKAPTVAGQALGRAAIAGLEWGKESTPAEAFIGADQRMMEDLLKLDKKIPKKAIENIISTTKDPGERLDMALEAAPKDDPEVQQIKRARAAQKAASVPQTAAPPAETGMSTLEKFRQFQESQRSKFPTNQQYIEGGGMPGVLMRALGRTVQPAQGAVEDINSIEARVKAALQARDRRIQ